MGWGGGEGHASGQVPLQSTHTHHLVAPRWLWAAPGSWLVRPLLELLLSSRSWARFLSHAGGEHASRSPVSLRSEFGALTD